MAHRARRSGDAARAVGRGRRAAISASRARRSTSGPAGSTSGPAGSTGTRSSRHGSTSRPRTARPPPICTGCWIESSPAATDRVADEQTLRFTLDEPATTRLIEAGGRLVRAPLDRALLAALIEALSASSRQDAWWIDVEGHGRDLELPDVDLGHTVGWFTSIYPVRLEAAPRDASTTLLQQIDETLRAVPSGGIAFGLATTGRAPAAVTARLRTLPDRGILFNFLGSFHDDGGAFSAGDGGLGGTRAPERLRTHPLAVEAAVVRGRLEVEFCFAGAQLDPAKVQDLADAMRRRLHAAAGGGRFPAARVPAAELDALVARIEARGGVTVADVYELTPMQGGMLFHRLFDAEGSVYFEQFSFVLEEAGRRVRVARGVAADRRPPRRLPHGVLLGRLVAPAPGGVRGCGAAVARRGLERAVAGGAGGGAPAAARGRHRAGLRPDRGAALPVRADPAERRTVLLPVEPPPPAARRLVAAPGLRRSLHALPSAGVRDGRADRARRRVLPATSTGCSGRSDPPTRHGATGRASSAASTRRRRCRWRARAGPSPRAATTASTKSSCRSRRPTRAR